jgi:hypothetical protein
MSADHPHSRRDGLLVELQLRHDQPPDVHTIQLLHRTVDEIRRHMRRLRVHNRILPFRVQQHFIQTHEHAVCLQQLHALGFDPLLEGSAWRRFS